MSHVANARVASRRGVVRALLLAGGLGTRLAPLTHSIPKCLVPLGGRPLLDYWVDNLCHAGVVRATINSHHLAESVRSRVAEVNASSRLWLTESFEPELLGSAGTVSRNRALADGADHVVIVYTDNLSSVDIGDVVDFHVNAGAPLTLLLFRSPNPSACGICSLDENGTMQGFTEKPALPQSNLANAGLYVATAAAYRTMADLRGHDLAREVLSHFVGAAKGYVLDGYHRDVGTLASLERAEADIACGIFQQGTGKRSAMARG